MQTTSPATAYTYGIIKSISYTVESDTHPGVFYTVAVNPLSNRPQSCTCPARKPCKHLARIAAGQFPGKPHLRYGPKVVMTPAMQRASDLYN